MVRQHTIRIPISILFLLFNLTVLSQDYFLDKDKKPVADGMPYVYKEMIILTDSGYRARLLNREDGLIATYGYKDSTREAMHGWYYTHYDNGRYKEAYLYNNGKRHGDQFRYYSNGKPSYIGKYYQGMPTDSGFYYDTKDFLYMLSVTDTNGNGMRQRWYPAGPLAEKGPLQAGKREGLWTGFTETGWKIMEINFGEDTVQQTRCFDALGLPTDGPCVYEKQATFPNGSAGWRRFLETNFVYPKDAIKADIQGVVWAEFKILKDGTLSDLTIATSPDELLSEAVIKIMKKSPNWEPAIWLNQPIERLHRQPVVFRLE